MHEDQLRLERAYSYKLADFATALESRMSVTLDEVLDGLDMELHHYQQGNVHHFEFDTSEGFNVSIPDVPGAYTSRWFDGSGFSKEDARGNLAAQLSGKTIIFFPHTDHRLEVPLPRVTEGDYPTFSFSEAKVAEYLESKSGEAINIDDFARAVGMEIQANYPRNGGVSLTMSMKGQDGVRIALKEGYLVPQDGNTKLEALQKIAEQLSGQEIVIGVGDDMQTVTCPTIVADETTKDIALRIRDMRSW